MKRSFREKSRGWAPFTRSHLMDVEPTTFAVKDHVRDSVHGKEGQQSSLVTENFSALMKALPSSSVTLLRGPESQSLP